MAVGFAAVQLYQDRKSRRAEAEESARAQAGSVWSFAGSFRGSGDQPNEYGFVIANASGRPFRDVEVEVTMHGRSQITAHVMVLPPGDFFLQLLNEDEWDYATSLSEYGKFVRPYTRTDRYRVREVAMTDASGRRWLLEASGSLRRLEDTTGDR